MLTQNPHHPAESSRFRRWIAHPLAVPVLMALVVLGVGAQVACSATIPTWSNDEPPHLGYIAALADGDLPTIDSPIVGDPEQFGAFADRVDGWDAAHDQIWTANHPPLYHLMLVPLWWAADGDPGSMFIAMRLVNTIGFALWVLLVAVIARELVPDRPAVPALAAVAAVTPTLAMRAGFLLNDGFSSTVALLGIWIAIRILRDRVTPARLVLLAAAGACSAGTRAPGVVLVAITTVVLLLVLWRREGWRTAIVASAVTGGVPAVATGWFYLRNLSLYGDLTGQSALLEKFERQPVRGLSDVPGIPSLVEGAQTTWPLLVALVLLAPTVAVTAWRRGSLRLDPVWVLLGLHAAATVANIVPFLLAGGGYHDRYFMPLAPLLATAAALGMLAVGRWWRTDDPLRRDWQLATAWSVLLLVWLVIGLTWMQLRHVFYPDAPHPVGGTLPGALLGLAAAAGVLVVVAFARRAVAVSPGSAMPVRRAAPVLTD